MYIFAKIHMSRSLYTIRTLTKIDLIHIHFQDFLFCIMLFNAQCQQGFHNLTFKRTILCQKSISRQLLSNRRTTFCYAVMSNIDLHSTHDTNWIDTMMAIKTIIFCSNKGILQIFWNVRQFHRQSIFL